MIIDESKKKTKLPKLLRKATELFVQQGINATTTKEIAKRARIAEGTIYRHFKSKNEMAYYIFHTNLKDLTEHLFAAIESASTMKAKLQLAIECFYNYYEENNVLFNFILLNQHQELRKFANSEATPRDVVLKIIAFGKRQGQAASIDNELAAAMVLGIVSRVAEAKAHGRITKDLRKLTGPVTEACWRVLKK